MTAVQGASDPVGLIADALADHIAHTALGRAPAETAPEHIVEYLRKRGHVIVLADEYGALADLAEVQARQLDTSRAH